ncbi:uncharacterized protein N7477_007462 [Penicillium maclennaniae]|uniref:uncharacterized protein n=1 Tax=Penicillium maclennaniae TaxID=1343394 RepID=UPI00254233AC|nr:uncharacterized protein N7477_007462 [Penicillium maclennaniae]KAJ5665014.1 hypothetical protein N7477_007462 [Penicillium maclennaniae]
MGSYFGHSIGLAGWFVRAIQAVSAVIVLGITAWAVEGTETVMVVYLLVIASLTLVILVLALGISYMTRCYRWHIFLLLLTGGVLSYLSAYKDGIIDSYFILLALDFNRTNCRRNCWNGEVNCSRSYTAEAFSFIALPVREMEENYLEERVAENFNAAGLI